MSRFQSISLTAGFHTYDSGLLIYLAWVDFLATLCVALGSELGLVIFLYLSIMRKDITNYNKNFAVVNMQTARFAVIQIFCA